LLETAGVIAASISIRGASSPVESFRSGTACQNAGALDAGRARHRLAGSTYIKQFHIFAARPDVLNVPRVSCIWLEARTICASIGNGFAQYCASGRKQVHGWLNPVGWRRCSCRFLLLQDSLGIQGGTAGKIGVHHGQSPSSPSALGLHDNERAVCVDIFEDQTHNVDLSGQGSREKART